jgi:hypothetical protein
VIVSGLVASLLVSVVSWRRGHLPVALRLRLRHVRVVLIRDKSASGYDLALVITDLDATPAQVIERYAARWSIEVAICDTKQAATPPPGIRRRPRRSPRHDSQALPRPHRRQISGTSP